MTAYQAVLAAEQAIRAIPVSDETVSYRAQALHAINGLLDGMALERSRSATQKAPESCRVLAEQAVAQQFERAEQISRIVLTG